MKAYLRRNARAEYLCDWCDGAIHRHTPYTVVNKPARHSVNCKMHITCVKPLIQRGWVSYLDTGNGYSDGLESVSPESSWTNLLQDVTPTIRQ